MADLGPQTPLKDNQKLKEIAGHHHTASVSIEEKLLPPREAAAAFKRDSDSLASTASPGCTSSTFTKSYDTPERRGEDSKLPVQGGDSNRDASAQVCKLIRAALARGVPMYNAGDAAGCARLYTECCQNLLQVNGIDEGSRMALLRVLDANVTEFRSGVKPQSASDRAWALRHCLDDVLAAAKQQQQSQSPPRTSTVSEMKQILRDRGVSEAEISTCSEKKDLQELLKKYPARDTAAVRTEAQLLHTCI